MKLLKKKHHHKHHNHKQHNHHHHHHHRHHEKHRKNSIRSILGFRSKKGQKHYRKHRSKKWKMSIKRFFVIIALMLMFIGIPLGINKLYDHSNKKVAEQTRLENQSKREENQALERDISARMEEIKEIANTYLPGFVCWGESLTAGSGGNDVSYPKILEELINTNLSSFAADLSSDNNSSQKIGSQQYPLPHVNVINMGARNENTATTLGRNGAVPFVLDENVTIPADTSSVEIYLTNSAGETVMPKRVDSKGMDYVVIGGITGELENQTETTENGVVDHFMFSRKQAGGEITLHKGTEVVTSGSLENLNLIPIIFIGQNEKYDTAQELIQKQQAIINHQQVGEKVKERYLIIGQPFGYGADQERIEKAMEDAYGLQYINVHDYMIKQGLADAGMTATENDKAMILEGKIPESLCSDNTHFNEKGYELLGKFIYQRMVMLGYFEEVETALQAAISS